MLGARHCADLSLSTIAAAASAGVGVAEVAAVGGAAKAEPKRSPARAEPHRDAPREEWDAWWASADSTKRALSRDKQHHAVPAPKLEPPEEQPAKVQKPREQRAVEPQQAHEATARRSVPPFTVWSSTNRRIVVQQS